MARKQDDDGVSAAADYRFEVNGEREGHEPLEEAYDNEAAALNRARYLVGTGWDITLWQVGRDGAVKKIWNNQDIIAEARNA